MTPSRTHLTLTLGIALASAATSVALLAPTAVATASPKVAHGLTAGDRLVTFPLSDPSRARIVGEVSGLVVDTALIGIDVRPADGELYAVGNLGGIYVVDTSDASLEMTGRLTSMLEGGSWGVDVNPAADALRIVSDTGQNLRYAFATGATSADTDLDTDADVATPTQGIVGAAYVNVDTDPTSGTALLDLDVDADGLALQVPANDGILTRLGPLGIDLRGQEAGFDVASRLRGGVAVHNTGFLVGRTEGRASRLFRVDLLSGRAVAVGSFPGGTRVVDLAVVPAG